MLRVMGNAERAACLNTNLSSYNTAYPLEMPRVIAGDSINCSSAEFCAYAGDVLTCVCKGLPGSRGKVQPPVHTVGLKSGVN